MEKNQREKPKITVFMINGIRYNLFVDTLEDGVRIAERITRDGFTTADEYMPELLEVVPPHGILKVEVVGAGKYAEFTSKKTATDTGPPRF